MSVTIVLADDHHVVRQALRVLLESEPDFAVVGEAADGVQAVERVRSLRPDLLLVDLRMPGLGGAEVVRQVAHHAPATRAVVLSMHASEPHVLDALRSGARGFVSKDATAQDLMHALREVAAGHLYLSPPFSDLAIEAYRQRAETAHLDPYDTLTEREKEVLVLAAGGLSNAELAARLGISPRTAETHRTNLMRKLGLRRQADLLLYALRRGIVSLGQDGPRDGG